MLSCARNKGIRVLLELRVENYAVIDNVVVEFAPGLNLLTGETGAGKSILIDALTLLLGDKASADVIRHGTDKAVVAAVFEAEPGGIAPVLEENGLDAEGDQIILRREITANGRGRVFINNQPATVSVLKQLAPHLAVIHAQNAAVLGFDPASRLALLDSYAGADLHPTTEAHAKWREITARIADLERDEQDRLRLLDLWKFQREEIDQADLKPGEDEALEAEKRVLANSERVFSAAMGAFDHLYEAEGSASEQLKAAAKQLEDLARLDEKFREQAAAVESARITIEDIGVSLRDYAEGIQASPERLAEIEDRLALLDRLKRKYGKALDEVIAYGADLARKLNEMENKDEVLRVLKKDLAKAAEAYLDAARTLSRKRYDAAKKLEKMVETEVNDLAMKARFKIEIGGTDEESNWTASGFDQVAYMISANPGEPLGPVEQIASGGELSRVMLALKASVEAGKSRSKKDPAHQRTLVFDEIDTGIGGRAAEAVGKKLKALSKTKQVLCITHLPQIASFADHHYLIEKKEASGRTKTTVRPLDLEDRTEEIARMLSGAKLTETSLKHAEQMLKANG
ncbi:DNA replication and repair protein RecN [Candidatus Koribacter versatilis Ellin345]|uniref:DNA repair protein RecN n=1 Tax=Koribacter versatilis (strain Ellin345) TaxID=204669 RepID=Q1IU49_KORVE|nr:DNA replication and repair protein RecN [Candidatus Koribacter versatilis Ellin345]